MPKIKFIFALLLAAVLVPSRGFAADSTRVRAILVVASNEKGGSDPKLAPYEPTLRRILRFQSYRAVGEGTASVSHGGKSSIKLPGGNQVDLQGGPSGEVNVMRGGQPIAVGRNPVVVIAGSSGDKGDQFAIIVTLN